MNSRKYDLRKLKGINKKMYLDLNSERKAIATRSGFGDALAKSAKTNKKIWGLCADLTGSVKMDKFAQAFPKRFVQVGVAEQNLVTVASGIAATGKIPFAAGYAAFVPGRCLEQIRTTICYNNQNVKIIASHAGVTVGPDGATHQALEDIAIMRSLPNMQVIVPSDYHQTAAATKAITKQKGPAYLRLSRNNSTQITTAKTPFTVGKANILKQGSDVALIATGQLVSQVLIAALILQEQGINAMVIDNHTIKPLDQKTILQAAKKCKHIVTIEEHQVTGGLGGAVAEFLSQAYPTRIKRIGMQDRYGESGEPGELIKYFKLNGKSIAKEVKKFLRKR